MPSRRTALSSSAAFHIGPVSETGSLTSCCCQLTARSSTVGFWQPVRSHAHAMAERHRKSRLVVFMYFPSLLPAVPVPEFPALSVPSMWSPALPPIPPATASAVVPPGQSARFRCFGLCRLRFQQFFLRRFTLGILCKIVLRCLIPNRLNTAAAVQVAAKCALPECARLTDAVDKIVAFSWE